MLIDISEIMPKLPENLSLSRIRLPLGEIKNQTPYGNLFYNTKQMNYLFSCLTLPFATWNDSF